MVKRRPSSKRDSQSLKTLTFAQGLGQKGLIGGGPPDGGPLVSFICIWIFIRILPCSANISKLIGMMNMKATVASWARGWAYCKSWTIRSSWRRTIRCKSPDSWGWLAGIKSCVCHSRSASGSRSLASCPLHWRARVNGAEDLPWRHLALHRHHWVHVW